MLHPRTRSLLFFTVLTATLALGGAGCIFSPNEDPRPPEVPPLTILPSTPPENLLKNLQTIYNDKEHSALERLNEYQKLFNDTDFLFHFQPVDYQNNPDIPQNWGKDGEIEAHRGLFTAQENGEIYSLSLAVTYAATDSVEGNLDWEEIFASNVQLRLLFNPNDGLEVNGGQAEFTFVPDLSKPPASGARFYGGYWIGDWVDLPRP